MMNKYVYASKDIFFSFLTIVPLVIIYEILAYVNNFKATLDVRNGADVAIRNIFHIFGGYEDFVYSFGLILFLAFIFFRNKNSFLYSEINLSFMFLMILESLLYALSLHVILNILFSSFLMASNPVLDKVYMSIGAGIWEEVLFRYFLIYFMVFTFKKLFNRISFWDYFLIVIISSYIFSIYHFMGPFGEVPSMFALFYRFIAGLILCLIFIFRGLGITVYTHTFFNLYLIF